MTVEDAYELRLHEDPRHPNTPALQARSANVEGAGAVELAELVRWGLRMNPESSWRTSPLMAPRARNWRAATAEG